MDIQEIIKAIFGDPVTMDSIMSVVVAIYAFVVSLWNIGAKKRVIKSDVQAASYTKEAAEAKVSATETKEAVSLLSNMLLTIFLNANTLDVNTKKQLSQLATKLDGLSCNVDSNVSGLLEKILAYDPEKTIVEKKEELIKETEAIDSKLSDASEVTNSAIDELKL